MRTPIPQDIPAQITLFFACHGLAISLIALMLALSGCGGESEDKVRPRWPSYPVNLVLTHELGPERAEAFVRQAGWLMHQTQTSLFQITHERPELGRAVFGTIRVVLTTTEDTPRAETVSVEGQIVQATIHMPVIYSHLDWAAAHELTHALGVGHRDDCRFCLMAPEPPPTGDGWELHRDTIAHIRGELLRN